MGDAITISLNKRTLSAFTLIAAGFLMLQAWWLRSNAPTTNEIRAMLQSQLGPIVEDQATISERVDVLILNFMQIDQRMRLIEQAIGINTKKQASKQEASAIIEQLDSLHAQLDRWRKDTAYYGPHLFKIEPIPPDDFGISADSAQHKHIRSQRMNIIPYLNLNQSTQ